jgi:putative FmdB family regulatory protein
VPTYQYVCTECGEPLEKVQKFSDDPLTVCPNCSGRLRKVFSPVGIVFKGSGFYRNDSRAGSNGSLTGGKDGKDKDGGKDSASPDRADVGAKSDSSSSDKSSATSDSSSSSSSKDSGSGSSGSGSASSSGSSGKSSGSTSEKVA